MAKKKLRLNYSDDETLEISIVGKAKETRIITVNHDEHGWAGMAAARDTAQRIATRLGLEIIEDGEENV